MQKACIHHKAPARKLIINPFAWILLLLIYPIVMNSCTKTPVARYTEPAATFQYNVYGSEIFWNDSDSTGVCSSCGPRMINDGSFFILRSTEAANPSHYIMFRINSLPAVKTFSDTVKTLTSFDNASHKFSTQFFEAAATEPGDYATISVTSIREGLYCDGTFNARFTFSPHSFTSGKLDIQNGEFHNVRIY